MRNEVEERRVEERQFEEFEALEPKLGWRVGPRTKSPLLEPTYYSIRGHQQLFDFPSDFISQLKVMFEFGLCLIIF